MTLMAGVGSSQLNDALVPWGLQTPQVTAFAPSNPATTVSATAVMMGLGSTIAFTPTRSGNIVVLLEGNVDNATAGSGVAGSLAWGTGTAPINGAASTGTAIGVANTFVNAVTNGALERGNWVLAGLITGAVPGTALWVDVTLQTVTGGTARIRAIECLLIEL